VVCRNEQLPGYASDRIQGVGTEPRVLAKAP
jgi:hypothetical protein